MTLYTIDDLQYLMQRLRDPRDGCPWDLKQSLTSINGSTIEEAYELVDALQQSVAQTGKADAHVKEELGDLLFQVIFYSQLTKEEGSFDFNDVVHQLTAKLIRRHPHVFPNQALHERHQGEVDEAEVKRQWEAIKAEERAEKAQGGIFDDVPKALPALKRAQKIQKRAANFGFDWPDAQAALEKVSEELAELKQAITELDDELPASKIAAEDELADLLFSCVNVARHLSCDSESVLERANQKFVRRFSYIEQSLNQQKLSMESASLAQMDALWDEAKQEGL